MRVRHKIIEEKDYSFRIILFIFTLCLSIGGYLFIDRVLNNLFFATGWLVMSWLVFFLNLPKEPETYYRVEHEVINGGKKKAA